MMMRQDVKLHYKMYKRGRVWVFMGILAISSVLNFQSVHADTTEESGSSQSTTDIAPQITQTATDTKQVKLTTSASATNTKTSATASQQSTAANTQAVKSTQSAVSEAVSQPSASASQASVASVGSAQSSQSAVNTSSAANESSQQFKSSSTSKANLQTNFNITQHQAAQSYADSASVSVNLRQQDVVSRAALLKDASLTTVSVDDTVSQNRPAIVPATATDWGTLGTSDWYVDNKVLHIEAGTLDEAPSVDDMGIIRYSWPWQKDASSVVEVDFDGKVVAPTATTFMFDNFTAVTKYQGLSNLDVTNVNSMYSMFGTNSSLLNIDFSGWNVANLVNTGQLFINCYKLQSAIMSKVETKKLSDASAMFLSCESLESIALNGLTLENATNVRKMFSYCVKLTSLGVDELSVRGQMVRMFAECGSLENLTLNLINGNSSNDPDADYQDTKEMFQNCKSLKTLSFTNKVKFVIDDATSLFDGCASLKQIDVNAFDFTKAVLFYRTFYDCKALTSVDMTMFKGVKPEYMAETFMNCTSLTSLDLTTIDAENVDHLYGFLSGCSKLTSLNFSTFTAPYNLDTAEMFKDCTGLVDLDLTGLKVSQIMTSTAEMFSGCTNLKSINLGGLETAMVTNMQGMFKDCTTLKSIDLSPLNTTAVADMHEMFSGCEALTNLDLTSLDTAKVAKMQSMFKDCTNLKTIDLKSIDTNNVTDMSHMFDGCKSLTTLDLARLSTEKVTDMSYMFSSCSNLQSIDIKKLNLKNVTDMSYMLAYCDSLKDLDLSSLSLPNVTNMGFMLTSCQSLQTVSLTALNAPMLASTMGILSFCPSLQQVDLSNTVLPELSGLDFTFYNDVQLRNVDLEHFSAPSLVSLMLTFNNCRQLSTIDLSSLDVPVLTYLVGTFANCSSLKTVNLKDFNAKKINYFWWAFLNDSSLSNLDLSNLNMQSAQETTRMYTEKLADLTSLNDLSAIYQNFSEMLVDGQFSGVQDLLKGTTALSTLIVGKDTVLSGAAMVNGVKPNDYAGYWLSSTNPTAMTSGDLMQLYKVNSQPDSLVTYQRTVEPVISLKAQRVTYTIGVTPVVWSATDNYQGGTDELGQPIDVNRIGITWNQPLNLQQPGTYTVTYAYKTKDGIYTKLNQTTVRVVYPVNIKLKSTDITMYIGSETAKWQPIDNILSTSDEQGQPISKTQLGYTITSVARSFNRQLNLQQPGYYQINYIYTNNDGDQQILATAYLTLLQSDSKVTAQNVTLIADKKQQWTSELHQVTAIDETGQPVSKISTQILNLKTHKLVKSPDTSQAGNYQITFSFVDGTSTKIFKTVKLSILANLAAIDTRSSQLTVGEQWQAKANLVSATDYAGNPLTINDLKVDGTVNWQQPGQYLVRYTYDKNPALTPIIKTALITVVAAVAPVNPTDPGNGDGQPEPSPEPEPAQPAVVPDQPVERQQPAPSPAPTTNVDTGEPVKPTTEVKPKMKPIMTKSKVDVQKGTESSSNAMLTNQRGHNQLSRANAKISLAPNHQAATTTLPQTNDTHSTTWLTVLGIDLLGLLSLLGFRRRIK